jgi:hypothetical protein
MFDQRLNSAEEFYLKLKIKLLDEGADNFKSGN